MHTHVFVSEVHHEQIVITCLIEPVGFFGSLEGQGESGVRPQVVQVSRRMQLYMPFTREFHRHNNLQEIWNIMRRTTLSDKKLQKMLLGQNLFKTYTFVPY